MPFITTRDDTDLYVKQLGDSGRDIVLIHGWPLNADSWDDVALTLAQAGHRVIAYDRRGFGRSDQPWHGYDYDSLADDLADVIDAAEVEDAVLVGFSMGGGEVARYLSRHDKAKVKQVGLISSVVPFMLKTADNPDGVPSDVFEGMKKDIRSDRAGFMQGFAPQFYGNGWISKAVSQGVLDATFQMAMTAGLWPTLACVTAFSSTDFRSDLAAFDLPTLILHGTEDRTVPIDISARKTAAAVPNSRLIEYEGAAHGVLVTHKNEVARDLLAFIDQA